MLYTSVFYTSAMSLSSEKLCIDKCDRLLDRPQSLFDSYLKNFTAKLDLLTNTAIEVNMIPRVMGFVQS